MFIIIPLYNVCNIKVCFTDDQIRDKHSLYIVNSLVLRERENKGKLMKKDIVCCQIAYIQ